MRGRLPRDGGTGEFVDAGSALGDVLAVFLCPLRNSLALLAQPRPQVLGLGVGAFAQLIGAGCPLRSWRALLVAGQPEGTWARLDAGPRCRALRRCRPGRRNRSRRRRRSGQGSCGLPW